MIIRKATEDDLYGIAQIGLYNWCEVYKSIFPESYLNSLTLEDRWEHYKEYLDCNGGLIVAADCENNVLGFAAYRPDEEIENCIYLDSLHTDKDARGKGIGTSLIRYIINIAKGMDCNRMSVCIVRGNENAERLYKKLGANHLKFFVDNDAFQGIRVESEKLIWELC